MRHYILTACLLLVCCLFVQGQENNAADNKVVLAKIATPARGTVVLTATVAVEIADKTEKVVFLKNGQLLGEGKKEDAWSYQWNTIDSSDDVYQIAAQAIVGQEQFTSASCALTIDNTAPAGKLVLPADAYSKSPLVVKVEATDIAMAQVSLLVNEQPFEVTFTRQDSLYVASVDFKESGTYQLSAVLTDQAGNRTQIATQPVQIDNKPPHIRFATNPPILMAANGSAILHVQDDHAGVARLRFGLGNLDAGAIDNPGDKLEVPLAVAGMNEGSYTLMAEATDKAGNIAQESISLIIDRNPPQVTATVDTPQISAGMVHISVKAEDAISGLDSAGKPQIAFVLLGQEYAVACSDWQEGVCQGQLLVTASYPEGEGKLYLTGIHDKAGNQVARLEIGMLRIGGQKIGGGWPLEPRDAVHAILPACSPHAKKDASALWIASAPLAEVKAIEDGRVVEVLHGEGKISGYLRVARTRGDLVWGYHHLVPGDNPEHKRRWLPGDVVKAGDTLGVVTPVAQFAESYLYLEFLRTTAQGYQSEASPLAHLVPVAPLTFASPKVLLASRSEENAWRPYLQFELPLSYHQPQPKQASIHDFWIVIYLVLLLVTLSVIALLSKAPNIAKNK